MEFESTESSHATSQLLSGENFPRNEKRAIRTKPGLRILAQKGPPNRNPKETSTDGHHLTIPY